MKSPFKKQFCRLSLFVATWFFCGLVFACFAWHYDFNANTDLGEVGGAMKGILESGAILLGFGAPALGAMVFWMIAHLAWGGWRAEFHSDANEIGNDALAVLYNGLAFAFIALCEFTLLGMGNWTYAAYGILSLSLAVVIAFAVASISGRPSPPTQATAITSGINEQA